MSFRYLPCVLALAVLTSACSSDNDVQIFGGTTDVINSHITLSDGRVTIKTPGAPNATIDQNGQLAIDGHDVAVNDAQRALLQRYNGAARQTREHAMQAGKAGVATASKELGAVAGKMTGADTAEQTKQKVEDASKDILQAAAKICDDMVEMKTAQDQLAVQLDAFKPYATALNDESVEKCRKDTKR
jgi:hypothetical protein